MNIRSDLINEKKIFTLIFILKNGKDEIEKRKNICDMIKIYSWYYFFWQRNIVNKCSIAFFIII